MDETTSEGLAQLGPQSELSLIGLLLEADPVVKAVLVALLIASVWSWAVIIDRGMAMSRLKKKLRKFEDSFWNGRVEDYEPRPGQAPADPGSRIFAAIGRDWADARRGLSAAESEAAVARAERSLAAAVDREAAQASKGLQVLATVGSASPFIGLFGTVWGIMNAFLKIGQSQDTSLATVAGPIAEALFATGMGLIAAIPAVIFYNKYSSDLNLIADRMDAFSQDLLVRLSRMAGGRGPAPRLEG